MVKGKKKLPRQICLPPRNELHVRLIMQQGNSRGSSPSANLFSSSSLASMLSNAGDHVPPVFINVHKKGFIRLKRSLCGVSVNMSATT